MSNISRPLVGAGDMPDPAATVSLNGHKTRAPIAAPKRGTTSSECRKAMERNPLTLNVPVGEPTTSNPVVRYLPDSAKRAAIILLENDR